jgi:hypothetical protein
MLERGRVVQCFRVGDDQPFGQMLTDIAFDTFHQVMGLLYRHAARRQPLLSG